MTLIIALGLFFVFLTWVIFITIIANQMLADYRAWKRTGREIDPDDRDMLRLCYVTLMVALWLGWW